jgi:hypothetical protein
MQHIIKLHTIIRGLKTPHNTKRSEGLKLCTIQKIRGLKTPHNTKRSEGLKLCTIQKIRGLKTLHNTKDQRA